MEQVSINQVELRIVIILVLSYICLRHHKLVCTTLFLHQNQERNAQILTESYNITSVLAIDFIHINAVNMPLIRLINYTHWFHIRQHP